jgi:hypothetical protein
MSSLAIELGFDVVDELLIGKIRVKSEELS